MGTTFAAGWLLASHLERVTARMRLLKISYLGAQRYGYGMWSGDIDSGFGSMAEQRTRMLTSVNRVHGTQNKQRQPWVYGATAESAARRAIELRSKLMPYLYAH